MDQDTNLSLENLADKLSVPVEDLTEIINSAASSNGATNAAAQPTSRGRAPGMTDAQWQVQQLREKLIRARGDIRKAEAEKKLLEEMVRQNRDDLDANRTAIARRDDSQDNIVQQLLQRQAELNIMLNKAHDLNTRLTFEVSELCMALPEPAMTPEVKKRTSRIEDLFAQSGKIQEEVQRATRQNIWQSPQTDEAAPAAAPTPSPSVPRAAPTPSVIDDDFPEEEYPEPGDEKRPWWKFGV